MAAELLEKYGMRIREMTLIPSQGGVYEVVFNENLIFSKKSRGRFPELPEIVDLIEKD